MMSCKYIKLLTHTLPSTANNSIYLGLQLIFSTTPILSPRCVTSFMMPPSKWSETILLLMICSFPDRRMM